MYLTEIELSIFLDKQRNSGKRILYKSCNGWVKFGRKHCNQKRIKNRDRLYYWKLDLLLWDFMESHLIWFNILCDKELCLVSFFEGENTKCFRHIYISMCGKPSIHKKEQFGHPNITKIRQLLWFCGLHPELCSCIMNFLSGHSVGVINCLRC